MRAGLLAAVIAGIMLPAPTRSAQQVSPTNGEIECPGPKVDLVFIIDSSGSLDINRVGQSYNVQIEGVLRALRDPSVIPRDGSVAVAVETFDVSGTIQAPLTEIASAADAETIAALVEGLRCSTITCNPTAPCPVFGSTPGTNYAPAIRTADSHLSQNQRAGGRRVLLLSSDGQLSDLDFAVIEAQRAGDTATALGVQFELDIILMTLDPDAKEDAQDPSERSAFEAFQAAKDHADKIVYPKPPNDLPGKTLSIKNGASNNPCARLDDSAVKSDFDRQVRDFVEHTSRVLRGQAATRFVTVTTEADPAPNTPVIGEALSFRQAIELANSNGGSTTITFHPDLKDKTISPRLPLPALNAPDIRICGCEEMNCDYSRDPEKKCDPFLTIDGSQTDTSKGEEHSDGILIRSNRAVVRGLRIINFAGAGVGIQPICNRGFSRIENNRFENNKQAGVRVLDSVADPDGGGMHNVGNTISMNDILGSETPIDLGGDGPTQNDPGDLDEGPNTLINFPETLSVVTPTSEISATANGVSLTGQVKGQTAAGAKVEIFAITSFKQVPDGRVIDGVVFLQQSTTNADGVFTVTGLPDSPTCGYTATVTDVAGNTSELMFPCAGFALARATDLDFGSTVAPNADPQRGTFSIENTGCSRLVVSFASISRNGFSKKLGDDLAHFDILSMLVGENGTAVAIEPGRFQQFTATFNPAIPKVVKRDSKLHAAQVLSAETISTLKLSHNGCANSDQQVVLTGRVDGAVKLIDPERPRNGPRVTLTRSGDELSVGFSVFDSDLDVNRVNYEFFKIRDNQCTQDSVPAEIVDQDLGKAIRSRGLVTGQSFTVTQRFSGAKKNPEAGCVRVTVSDGKTSASGTSSPANGLVGSASLAPSEFGLKRIPTIVRPAIELPNGLEQPRAPKTRPQKEKGR